MKNLTRWFSFVAAFATALFSLMLAPRAEAQPSGYALDFSPASNNYVSVNLTAPPASNYTLTAWVKLRSGGTLSGTRMAVVDGTTCSGSIELLLRPNTEVSTDPQYLELGRCGVFNGTASTMAVPFNAWTHIAVTVSSNKLVSYFVNGSAAGSWDGTGKDFSFASTVRLGANGLRQFDGQLDQVQLWNRELSVGEIQTNVTQQFTGSESGLYAWYPFNEGSGGATTNAAIAAGGSTGTLVNNPVWIVPITVVTTTADSGAGSLRAAVADLVSPRMITFDPSLSGQTITLTSGQITISNAVTIDASSLPAGIAISGNNSSRVFQVASNVTASLTGLTIRDGFISAFSVRGAGINNQGTLTLARCTFLGNTNVNASGGALYNERGTLTLAQCALLRNYGSGGAIANLSGTVVLTQTTLSGNAAITLGGAILTQSAPLAPAQCTLAQCTLTGNTSISGSGGAIAVTVSSAQSTLALVNCTLTENSAGPFIGGAIYSSGFTATNCIIAGNSAASSLNFNGTLSGANNITNGTPLLAPLADYGGPTQTMPPLLGSPAIDAGNDSVATAFPTDQRGFPRLAGAHVDIGAVELPVSLVVLTNTDAGYGSLRDAVTYGTNNSTITFAPALSGQTITLTSGQLTLSNNVTVDASSLPGGIQIDGNHNSRVLEIASGTVVLNSLGITNGYSSTGQGGGIKNSGALTLNQCTLSGNSVSGAGGGLYNFTGGVVTLNNCTLNGNTATNNNGGGISAPGGMVTLNQCTLTGNSTVGGGNGGGIAFSSSGGAVIYQCTLAQNSSVNAGGGIYSGNGALTVSNSIVAGNTQASGSNITGTGTYTGVNLTNGNPLLAPLGNYGGPTPTMPPLPGSPAIDGATNGTSFTTDQRGQPRILGAFADLGAVEGVFNPNYPLMNVTKFGNGNVQFAFTNLSGPSYRVLASANAAAPLNTWSNLGVPTESPAGTFTFTDLQATNYPQRFYRVTTP